MLPLHVYLRKHLCSITISIADNFQIDPALGLTDCKFVFQDIHFVFIDLVIFLFLKNNVIEILVSMASILVLCSTKFKYGCITG